MAGTQLELEQGRDLPLERGLGFNRFVPTDRDHLGSGSGAPVATGCGLRGRRKERDVLERVIAGVRAGQSRMLVVRGDQGIGKTALLEYLVECASGCQIARATGVESETDLMFAGLHQLCAPFLGRIGRLPRPQRNALSAAFGCNDGGRPDRFRVGLAVLSLLSDVAKEHPLVCVVDDFHWLDRASAHAVAFVVRHLEAESVAIVFGVRRSAKIDDLAGLPELVVPALADGDARALLESALPGPLDKRVLDRIVAEAHGNPGTLLELPRGLTAAELAGGLGLLDTRALSGQLEQSFRRRLTRLPGSTRLLLLLAAAEPVFDPVLVWRAAELLGIEADAAGPGAVAGLVEPGGQVRFRHPLARSAVYRAASPHERQVVHRALAEATDPDTDPERMAWHRAHATAGLDEGVAAALERSAGHARARGGPAAGAAFLKLAAELTPELARRAKRTLAAARAERRIGAWEVARRLLSMAQSEPLDELDCACAALLDAQIMADSGRRHDAAPMLLSAARRLESLDLTLAYETYRDAFSATLAAGRLAGDPGMPEIAEAARSGPSALQAPGAGARLLNGIANLISDGHAAGAPMLQTALRAFAEHELGGEEFRWLPLACRVAHELGDDGSLFTLATRLIESARNAGALTVLPHGLISAVVLGTVSGDLAHAKSMVEEADAVAAVGSGRSAPYGSLVVAAWEGREADVELLLLTFSEEIAARGEGEWSSAGEWASAVLCNGLGHYHAALVAAERASAQHYELGWSTWSLPELIEAAVRSGSPERAHPVIRRLSRIASASGSDWLLGVAARSHALLGEGDAAELLYLEAIERLGRTRVRAELARSHLLYGEWLRRQHRRVDARSQLRIAVEMLTAMGVAAFAERARRELLATGETVRKRTDEARDELTPQEVQIARLAGEGRTNPEIGAELFISPRTVEWHLRKVFSKLGIASRKELRKALPRSDNWASPLNDTRSPQPGGPGHPGHQGRGQGARGPDFPVISRIFAANG
jgi:DNA-binding CsgD family transcriptional regulator